MTLKDFIVKVLHETHENCYFSETEITFTVYVTPEEGQIRVVDLEDMQLLNSSHYSSLKFTMIVPRRS